MYCKLKVLSLIISIILVKNISASQNPCSYYTGDWDSNLKKIVNIKKVHKYKSQLKIEERDQYSQCSICEEDQQWIKLEKIKPFRVCKYFYKQIKTAITHSREMGFPIYEVIGYRVSKSKGEIDKDGLRTRYSHHSYGTAIDINPKFNGLYDNCIRFDKNCILIRGGVWSENNFASINKNSVIYKEFLKIGWSWGGELKGKQKDFMHFSISGD